MFFIAISATSIDEYPELASSNKYDEKNKGIWNVPEPGPGRSDRRIVPCQKEDAAVVKSGTWRATLTLAGTGTPFHLDFTRNDAGGDHCHLRNAGEKILPDEIRIDRDSIDMPCTSRRQY